MENSLKNRYIYAVTRHLPTRTQKDVERELDSLISDMVIEQAGNDTPTEQHIKDVLTQLGSPEEMALKYDGGGRRALISGTYFLMYKLVLRIVLPIVAVVLGVLSGLGFVVGEPTLSFNIGFIGLSFFAQVIAAMVGGVIQAFAVITIVFAVLDYFKVDLKDGNILDLPEIPDSKKRISITEPIVGICIAIGSTILFLGFPQVIRAYIDFEWIHVFNVEVIRGLWFPILAWTVVEIIAELVKLAEGRYTKRLAAVTVVTAVLQIAFAFFIFVGNNLLNPELVYRAENYVTDFAPLEWVINNAAAQPNLIVLFIIVVVVLIETIEVVYNAFKR